MVRLRLRTPNGQSVFSGATFGELAAHIATTMPITSFELLASYPPSKLEWDEAMPLSSLLLDGDTVTVRASEGQVIHPVQVAPTSKEHASPSYSEKQMPRPAATDTQEDAQMQAAIAMSLEMQHVSRNHIDDEEADMQEALAISLGADCRPTRQAAKLPSSWLDDAALVRRVIAADNSCLFNAVAYALEDRSKLEAPRLREIVAAAVLSGDGEVRGMVVLIVGSTVRLEAHQVIASRQ